MQNKEVMRRIRAIKDTYGVWFSKQDHEALALGIKAIEERKRRLFLLKECKENAGLLDSETDRIISDTVIDYLEDCEKTD